MVQMEQRGRADTIAKPPSIRNTALGLLARREHSRQELQHKIIRKLSESVSQSSLTAVLDQLEEQGLLSDDRFTEAYVNMRARKGYGPVRIAMELAEKGISDQLAQSHLAGQDWSSILRQAWKKKFRDLPADYPEKMRQMRFLQFRGYHTDAIRQLLDK